jgi:predicted TIM-barrel fold metal-dependent hydrolase
MNQIPDVSHPDTFAKGFPHEVFRELRRTSPLVWHEGDYLGGPGYWIASRYATIVAISRQPQRFSSASGTSVEDHTENFVSMIGMDPPAHRRYRALVSDGFTPRQIAAQEPHHREIVRNILDRVIPRGQCDFVVDVAAQLPLRVIAELLGVPQSACNDLFDWSNRMIGNQDPEHAVDLGQAANAALQMFAFANGLAEDRLRAPQRDLMSAILHGTVDGQRLSALEFDSFFLLLAVAGNETTRNHLFTTRLPARHRERAPHVIRDARTGSEIWVVGDRSPITPLGHTAVAGWKDPFPAAPASFSEVPLAAHDPHARLRYMDSLAIWAMAVYPNVGGFGSQVFLGLKDAELMLACVRAYNDFLTDWCATDSRRLLPITALPFWDVQASVAEIERCAARGHRGILFTGEPHSHGMPVLANPHWNPLWECAQSLGLPISFHIGAGNFTGTSFWTPERIQHYGPGAVNGVFTTGLFLDNGKQIADLLFSGVLARYPSLEFVSVESGIGFVPFLLESCDYCYRYGQVAKQRPELRMLPSEYFARQVYSCYFFEEYAPAALLDRIPEDRVLFETDYPHPVCLYGNVREKIDAGLARSAPATRRKLLFDNAARIYRVDAPGRAPALAAA